MSCSYGQIKTPSSHDLTNTWSHDWTITWFCRARVDTWSYEQKRAMHDDKRMNYYDHLQYNAQKERTKINSAPTIKKYNAKGNIRHEPQTPTTKPVNYHTYALNHSVVTKSQRT